MSSLNLRYTVDARDDLMGILHFIARDNPPRAISFVEEIEAHCQRLKDSPLGRPALPEIGSNVRRVVYGNYNIYYFIADDAVVVFGVIEGHRRQAYALQNRI